MWTLLKAQVFEWRYANWRREQPPPAPSSCPEVREWNFARGVAHGRVIASGAWWGVHVPDDIERGISGAGDNYRDGVELGKRMASTTSRALHA